MKGIISLSYLYIVCIIFILIVEHPNSLWSSLQIDLLKFAVRRSHTYTEKNQNGDVVGELNEYVICA